MEFKDKLSELRKSHDLTQEELANILMISRTAISKWESGRGYPSIESLKQLAKYFDVSIDDLLSSDKVIDIAINENKHNIIKVCNMLMALMDIMAIGLIILPFYAHTVEGYIYSVNLLAYQETTKLNITIYWLLFLAEIAIGIIKLVFNYLNKHEEYLNYCSLAINIILVLFLSLATEPYANAYAFILLIVKIVLFIKIKNCK